MNILVLSWRGPGHPLAGGAEVSTLEHAKGWVKAGHQVTWFTSTFTGGKPEDVIEGVKVVRRGYDVFGVHLAAFWWYLSGNHSRFGLVVDQFHGIPFFTPLYVRTKKLVFIHEVTKEVWWLNPWPKPFNLIPGVLGTLLEPLVFRFFYRGVPFITVSESTKDDLISWGITKENITVVHNGVTVTKPKPFPEKEKKKTLIFLGALTKDKGIEDALGAFSLINQSDPNWQFWIVGKGDTNYVKILGERCIVYGIKDKIKFLGYVNERKKFELLARAHVLVNPSVREGWGLVNIEANSVGTPVVAYNVPGCRDSIINSETGLLCVKGSVKSLASGLVKLLEDKNKYSQMRLGAQAWSKNFSWEEASRKSLKLVESLAKL